VIREAVHDMVHRAIRLGGTCTGEHGVGNGKTEYLEEELGPGTVGLMETVKRTSESVDSGQFAQPCRFEACSNGSSAATLTPASLPVDPLNLFNPGKIYPNIKPAQPSSA
jgi:D-lactate dehydrogenase (cytochrome)